jgi:Zn finger protein HypA/HybF involved in hydrogenase expression
MRRACWIAGHISHLAEFMVVRFKCPNGHVLSAPEALVGRPGKCPQCQSAFVVPAAPESQEPDGRPGSGVTVGDMPGNGLTTGSGPIPGSGPIKEVGGSGTRATNAGETFVFLCPNGHRLNGPPSLKGKPGKCPHCHATFLIPTDDETITEEAEYEGEPEPPFPQDVHPLGHIVARLWHHKGEHGEIELFLPEGEILSPEHYSAMLSQRDYGVFATREGEAYQFTVIPWTTVRRVSVHRVEELPPDLFD